MSERSSSLGRACLKLWLKKRLHGRDHRIGESAPCCHRRCRVGATRPIHWTSKWQTRGKQKPNWKTLSHSSLCHASSPPTPASHSLFLYSLTAFMEERRQTWTQPWSQTLVNTSTYFPPSLPPLVFQSSCPYTWFLDALCWYFLNYWINATAPLAMWRLGVKC